MPSQHLDMLQTAQQNGNPPTLSGIGVDTPTAANDWEDLASTSSANNSDYEGIEMQGQRMSSGLYVRVGVAL